MNNSKRQFLKTLPLVAVSGLAVKLGERDAKAIEIKPNKRYVFRIDSEVEPEDLEQIRSVLNNRGFSDALLVAGSTEIYELEQPAK